jgi:hypothetical protein
LKKPTVSAAILAVALAIAAPSAAWAARPAENQAAHPAENHVAAPAVDPTCAFGYWCAPGMFNEPQPAVAPHAKLAHGIDRTQFLPELAAHPELIGKMAHMVFGEVGRDAPQKVKIVQLETAFNRAQARGQSLAHVLLSVTEAPDGGYYAGTDAPAGGTYGPAATPTQQEISTFAKEVLMPVMSGSNLSDVGYGPMTGNASGKVASHQFDEGMPGYRLAGGDSYFREGPFLHPFPELSPTAQAALGLGSVKAAAR